MNYINKDTKIYGSFSNNAGNNGCKTFNTCFRYYEMNCIYKSFSVDNIESAVLAAKTLDFKGFAISMPFKKEILNYVDKVDPIVDKIGSANTILNNDGVLTAYNTDYLAVKELLSEIDIIGDHVVIIGNGGFASAAKQVCVDLNIKSTNIIRETWSDLKLLNNCTVFNCTPVDVILDGFNTYFIDGRPTTDMGKIIANKQARYQFELYANKKFPLC